MLLVTISWVSYQIRKIAGCACAGNAGNVSPHHRLQRKPLASDPGMHHGTCVPHVPWCMSGSITRVVGGNVPGIPGACAPAVLRIWQEAHAVSQQTSIEQWHRYLLRQCIYYCNIPSFQSWVTSHVNMTPHPASWLCLHMRIIKSSKYEFNFLMWKKCQYWWVCPQPPPPPLPPPPHPLPPMWGDLKACGESYKFNKQPLEQPFAINWFTVQLVHGVTVLGVPWKIFWGCGEEWDWGVQCIYYLVLCFAELRFVTF